MDTKKVTRWSAEFADKDAEADYRRRNTAAELGQTRFSLWVWAGGLILFAYPDYLILGTGYEFSMLLAMRIVLAICILAFIPLMIRYPSLVMDGYGLALLSVLFWTWWFLLFHVYPRESIPWVMGMSMVILIGLFVFLPTRVVCATLVASYVIFGILLSMRWRFGTPPQVLISLGMNMLVPAIAGLFVSNRFQSAHRRVFAMLVEAESTNAELEKEIQFRRELETELKRQATTDPLTGLCNRRHYESLFHQELKRSQRKGTRLSILVLDLDRFKKVNDSYGHTAGDSGLRHLADLCRKTMREMDVIGRLGGEEFVALMPDTGLHEAAAVAERLRSSVEETDVPAGQARFQLTITIGVAELKPEDNTIEDLIRRADSALYEGKRLGRNQIRVAA